MKSSGKKRAAAVALLSAIVAAALSGCGSSPQNAAQSGGKLVAVGAENEYADVISQIGGQYVTAAGIMSDPETDPHSYEADTKDAALVGKAAIVVENGLGYDDFMDKLLSASPDQKRTVIDVAKALGYSDDTENPHLWYNPDTMPRVAALIEKSLEERMPQQKKYFEGRLVKFDASLKAWDGDLEKLKSECANTGVAVTEPVADYLVEAAGLKNETPWAYQAAVMNGTDPAPQAVKVQEGLFTAKKVKVFLYNRQAVDDSTAALLSLAKQNGIPVVGVYETMPAKYDYQQWMEAETQAVLAAIENARSTETLI